MSSPVRAVSYWFDDTSRLRMAEDLDSLNRAEITSLQQANFAATVDMARRSATVHERWPALDKVTSVSDLAQLPLLTPAQLADGCPPRSREFLLDGADGGLVIRSSGTAGRTKMVYHSWQSEWQVNFLGARGVRAALDSPPRAIANCMTPGELNGAFLFVHCLSRYLSAMTFPLGARTAVADTATIIEEHGIDTLVAAPAYGTELVTTMRGKLDSLHNYMYLGEALGRARRDVLRDAAPELNIRSFSYSTNETGPIGYQCRHAADGVHHVHEDGVIVEILDEDTGEPVPPGTTGELVVTRMSDAGMVLFRYQIGDRAYVNTESCPCGSAAMLITLVGRSTQSLNVDVWVISSDQLMSGLAGLGITDPADCQLQVLWDVTTYRLRLLLSPGTPAGITPEQVIAGVRDKYQLFKVMTNDRCASFTVERVDVTQFATTGRGKVPVLYQV
ncbi:MAG TPA: AMP-binding protein [Streptosporangiaceae bacterium]|nr:AMP-binding protein [Streptosporangiaceae bacterium]